MGDYHGYDNYDDWFCAEQDKINEERREYEEEERRREEIRAEQDRSWREMWDKEDDYYNNSSSSYSSNSKNNYHNSDYDDYYSEYNNDFLGNGNYSSGYSYSNNSSSESFWWPNVFRPLFKSLSYGFSATVMAFLLWGMNYNFFWLCDGSDTQIYLDFLTTQKFLWLGDFSDYLLVFVSSSIAGFLFKKKSVFTGIPLVYLSFIVFHESFLDGMYTLTRIFPIFLTCMILSVGAGFLFKKNLKVFAWIVIGVILMVMTIPLVYWSGWWDIVVENKGLAYMSYFGIGIAIGLIMGIFDKANLRPVSILITGIMFCLQYFYYSIGLDMTKLRYMQFQWLLLAIPFLISLLLFYCAYKNAGRKKEKE